MNMMPIMMPIFIPSGGGNYDGPLSHLLLGLGLFVFVCIWLLQIGIALIDLSFGGYHTKRQFLWDCVPILPFVSKFISKFGGLK